MARGAGAVKTVLSYGGGVQSVAIGRLILAGRLPRPDLIIFADTQAEPVGVYESVQREKALFDAAGIVFETVTAGDLSKLRVGKKNPYYTFTPLFTLLGLKRGMMRRTCTQRFKIDPIQKRLKQLGWKKERVALWLGISTDEAQRMNVSRVDWIDNVYPLIDAGMSRAYLENYLTELGVKPTKSACVFCPYRSAHNWREVKNNPVDWALAVDYDRSIRGVSPQVQSFVHASRRPLEDAVDDPVPGLIDDECAGICMT